MPKRHVFKSDQTLCLQLVNYSRFRSQHNFRGRKVDNPYSVGFLFRTQIFIKRSENYEENGYGLRVDLDLLIHLP